MENITESFIDYLINVSHTISIEAEKKARQCLIDYLGVTYAGAYYTQSKFVPYINSLGQCTVIGQEEIKVDAATAAFINGFNSHVMELDDGHRFGMIHLGSAIISSVLAVSQQQKICFKQILNGIIMGYEAAIRLAIALQPDHKKRGFHTTGTCGTIGAALGSAFALNYDKNQIKAVLSAAATSAAGLLAIQEDGSQLKAYNVAQAAINGVMATLIGKTNLCGPDDILGNKRGFLYIHSATVFIDKLIENKKYFEIERTYIKPYASCRHCHPAIEAILKLHDKYKINDNDIKRIYIDTYGLAIKGHDHKCIQGISSAKLSIPYSVAAAFILNTGMLESFSEDNLKNERISNLLEKVEISEKSEFTDALPAKRIAAVTIITKKSEKLTCQIDFAKGDPENPMTDKEILEKFRRVMEWCKKQDKANEIIEFFNCDVLDSKDFFEIITRI